MFDKVLSFFGWLLSLWGNLSDEDKEKIVDMIVDSFTHIFKAFYRSSMQSED